MVLDWLYPEHQLSVLPDALKHAIRHTDAFKTVLTIPIETERYQVTVEAIQEHFHKLAAEVENASAAFVLNADESGFQDFADAREVQGILPTAFEYDSIHIPSNRSEKRVTIISGIY
jgi:hypothetical protein